MSEFLFTEEDARDIWDALEALLNESGVPVGEHRMNPERIYTRLDDHFAEPLEINLDTTAFRNVYALCYGLDPVGKPLKKGSRAYKDHLHYVAWRDAELVREDAQRETKA